MDNCLSNCLMCRNEVPYWKKRRPGNYLAGFLDRLKWGTEWICAPFFWANFISVTLIDCLTVSLISVHMQRTEHGSCVIQPDNICSACYIHTSTTHGRLSWSATVCKRWTTHGHLQIPFCRYEVSCRRSPRQWSLLLERPRSHGHRLHQRPRCYVHCRG